MAEQTFNVTIVGEGSGATRGKIPTAMVQLLKATPGDIVQFVVNTERGNSKVTGANILRGQNAERARQAARTTKGNGKSNGSAKTATATAKSNGSAKTVKTVAKTPAPVKQVAKVEPVKKAATKQVTPLLKPSEKKAVKAVAGGSKPVKQVAPVKQVKQVAPVKTAVKKVTKK